MARTYVLGPNAARELKRLIRGTGGTSRRVAGSGALAFDSEYVPPYTVQWAQSQDSGNGAWIIWLPPGHLSVEGVEKNTAAGLTAATGYPTGWYVLDLGEDYTAGDDFSLWLDAHADASQNEPYWGIDDDDMTLPVRIADVVDEGKMVKQIVKSALVDLEPGIDLSGLTLQVSLRAARVNDIGAPYAFNLTSAVGLLLGGTALTSGSETTTLDLAAVLQDAFTNNSFTPVILEAGSGIVIRNSGGASVQSTSGGGTFTIEAVYV